MRSWRWYLYMFWQTIMLAMVNAWLLYRRDYKLLEVNKPMKQRSFQGEVASSLILLHSQSCRPSLGATSPPTPPKRIQVGSSWRCSHGPDFTLVCEMWQAWPLQIMQDKCNHDPLWEMWCVFDSRRKEIVSSVAIQPRLSGANNSSNVMQLTLKLMFLPF